MKDLKDLPVKIKQTWKKSNWEANHDFLRKYNTHIITSVSRGASFKLMTFAESPKSYSERDFEAKSCLLLAGPTATGEVGLKACADISQSEKSKASQMSTSDKVVALGGSLDTRNKLLDQETRSVDEIQNLLNIMKPVRHPHLHTFLAIWNILQTPYPTGSPNHIRV